MSSGTVRNQREESRNAARLTSQPAQDGPLDHPFPLGDIGEVVFVDVRLDRAWKNGVSADVVLAQRHRAALHEREDAGFCGRIVAERYSFIMSHVIRSGDC